MNTQLHLLIIDSNPHVVAVLQQTLKNDFTISVATSGYDAIRLLAQSKRFDCVITELNFPRFDGFDLLKTIRTGKSTKNSPILVLTSNSDSNTRIRCLDAGADSVITKPFNPLEVRAKLGAALRRLDVGPYQSWSLPTATRTVKPQNPFQQFAAKILSFII